MPRHRVLPSASVSTQVRILSPHQFDDIDRLLRKHRRFISNAVYTDILLRDLLPDPEFLLLHQESDSGVSVVRHLIKSQGTYFLAITRYSDIGRPDPDEICCVQKIQEPHNLEGLIACFNTRKHCEDGMETVLMDRSRQEHLGTGEESPRLYWHRYFIE